MPRLIIGDSAISEIFNALFASSRLNSRGAQLALNDCMISSDGRARTLALQKRSFEFTCAVIVAYPPGAMNEPSRIIWRELVKAATSSTFNLEEADAASSDADFLAKMGITLREAKEAHVAIRVIERCQLAGWQAVAKHKDEANQLASIFRAIVTNKRASMQRKRRS